MTYSNAKFYWYSSVWKIADRLAELSLYNDSEANKIRKQIEEHKNVIYKLETKLGNLRTKKAEKLLPVAERKKEEAEKIIELHEQVELEFNRRLKANMP